MNVRLRGLIECKFKRKEENSYLVVYLFLKKYWSLMKMDNINWNKCLLCQYEVGEFVGVTF